MSSNEVLLHSQALTIGYPGGFKLEVPEFQVLAGEVWYIVGPNGSGKSTLIKALTGEISPLSGEVHYSENAPSIKHIATIHQQAWFSPILPITVKEFVDLGLVGISLSRKQRSERITDALQRVRLEEHLRQQLSQLSGGQYQRAIVARSLARNPKLLLGDEPTTSLDVLQREALLECLKSLSQEGLGIILVTHDLNEVVEYGDKVILCDQAQAKIGSVNELIQAETLKSVFKTEIQLVSRMAKDSGEQ